MPLLRADDSVGKAKQYRERVNNYIKYKSFSCRAKE